MKEISPYDLYIIRKSVRVISVLVCIYPLVFLGGFVYYNIIPLLILFVIIFIWIGIIGAVSVIDTIIVFKENKVPKKKRKISFIVKYMHNFRLMRKLGVCVRFTDNFNYNLINEFLKSDTFDEWPGYWGREFLRQANNKKVLSKKEKREYSKISAKLNKISKEYEKFDYHYSETNKKYKIAKAEIHQLAIKFAKNHFY